MSFIRGRFHKKADELVDAYTASLPFDRRLYRYDIASSAAHARMLGNQGIITKEEATEIIRALKEIEQEIERGDFAFHQELEDIHMAIEARLIEMIGPTGGKLHTARSRNDQVALDMRLFTKDAIAQTLDKIKELQESLISLAEKNIEVILPGYTHLQPAQPVLLAHHLLAYFEMFSRDYSRLRECSKRTNVMPLGSGALAGVTYPIDREAVARELGFGEISANSMDAVSDRDYIIEYLSCASLLMMHLSRLAEELIIWSSAEFGFIEIDDAYSTSSSIMPQKKNPDVAELTRGKTGRVYGHLMAILTTMKGLPLAYNKDLQEDKEGLFDTVDTVLMALNVFSGMLSSLRINSERTAMAVNRGYLLATDIADYLAKKGESFRNAHGIVSRLVNYASDARKQFAELTLGEYQKFSPLFQEDVFRINVPSSLAARNIPGGTAPEQVKLALMRAKKGLEG